jgi:hypothetical protein
LQSCSKFLKWRLFADSRFKQRAVIKFLVHENESVVNIHKRLCAVYGSWAVNRSTVGWWVIRVKASGSAETKLHDLPRAGCPVFWDCDGVILVDVMPRGVTINSEAYTNSLNKLKKRFR